MGASRSIHLNSAKTTGSQPFLVIAGCQRSGTNLLASLIDGSNTISTPTESRFLTYFMRYKHLAGDLGNKKNMQVLLESIFVFLYLWESRDVSQSEVSEIAPYSLISTYKNFDEILSHSSGFESVVSKIFECFSRAHGKKQTLEKFTFQHFETPKRIQSLFPDIKILHIVRDGRDVALSWRKQYFGPRTLTESALRWSSIVQGLRDWGLNNPTRYKEVRYEDLLANSEHTIFEALDFFGVEHMETGDEEDMPQRAKILSSRKWMDLLSQPVRKENKGKWRTELSPADIMEFTWFSAPALQEFNYDVSGKVSRPGILYRCSMLLRALFQYLFCSNTWKRHAFHILPAFLILFGRCGLPVNRIFLSRLSRCLGLPER